jgi:hypothetical protein
VVLDLSGTATRKAFKKQFVRNEENATTRVQNTLIFRKPALGHPPKGTTF